MNTDEYGFYCDLEAQEDDEVEYYVVATSTHYEVRRKLAEHSSKKTGSLCKTSVQINGEQRMNIMTFESEKTSTPDFAKEDKKQPFCMCLPKDIFYSLCVCFTTVSGIYLIITAQNI
jgi:hypothetical protein